MLMALQSSNMGAARWTVGGHVNMQPATAPQAELSQTIKNTLDNVPRSTSGEYLTGPPPAFQASLLDLQSDIRTQLKRISAALSWPHNNQPRPDTRNAPDPALSAETGLSAAKWTRPGFQPLNARV